jgi:anti-sigma regulatory factor (Ser/Thr protein kinase)
LSDEITLTIPRAREYLSVAHLVLGGIGVRLNLTLETLEDLQLALDAILERDREPGDVTISVRLSADEIETEVGPLRDGVRRELARDSGDGVGLRRILDTLVDRVEATDREGGFFVTLRKTLTGVGA